jgi:putative transcriptional regulator
LSEVIYNRISMLRAERGVSRRQLAEALGVHYQTVGYLERGEYSPSLYLALRIAAYFEVPVEVIFATEPFARHGAAEGAASRPAADRFSAAKRSCYAWCSTSTVPWRPSTLTRSPLCSTMVALPHPTTAGMPSSRATIAA